MQVIINDKFIKREHAVVSAFNRSFRYGDGFFETMKMIDGEIKLELLHFERMFIALETLLFEKPSFLTASYFREKILALAVKNNHEKAGRIRLMFYRGDGGLYDVQNHYPNYIIETLPLPNAGNEFNENGLVTDIYLDARKACDNFSHIKSNNFLPYTMAALWAKKNKLNDAIILNSHNRIADATIANIFIVKDGIIKTPALSEGCISGVMRRHILDFLRKENMPVEESVLTADELVSAHEIFFTNAVYGIRWVKQVGKNEFTQNLSKYLFAKIRNGL